MDKMNEFIETIKQAVGLDSQMEVFLRYKEFPFVLEPHGEQLDVCSKGVVLGSYDSFDDMANNFIIDEKPFIERIDEIEYD